jgi:hypothetical protein
MAKSERHKIMDAVIAALRGVSGMATVSEEFKGYDELESKDFPACFPIDANEEHEQFAIGSGEDTMVARLTLLVTAYVHSPIGDTRRLRTDMLRDINKALLNDTNLAALILDIQPVSVQTDQGIIENYSLWNQEFEITYLYNRSLGG